MTGPTLLLPLGAGVRARLSGSPCVVMLDVDGTLAPIAPRPEDAVVPPETQKVVAALAARPSVFVALISGRAAPDARRMVGVSNVWVVGNHGAECITPSGDQTVDPTVAPFQEAIARVRATLSTLLAPVAGVIVEDKRWTLSVHYRQADPMLVPRVKATVERVAAKSGLRVHDGKMVFEVRPPVRVDKGTAVVALADRLGGLAEGASLLFIGDDRTDEDAFRLLRQRVPHAVTVRVADEQAETDAEFLVADPPAVRGFLRALAGSLGAPDRND
ncbi:MAG: trehalose-phosphatase [Gemmatimonadaceae bacterium]